MTSLFAELKRRNVLRAGTAYIAVSWLVIQVLDALLPIFGVLAVALVYFAFDKFILDPARDKEIIAEATEQARDDALIGSYGEQWSRRKHSLSL